MKGCTVSDCCSGRVLATRCPPTAAAAAGTLGAANWARPARKPLPGALHLAAATAKGPGAVYGTSLGVSKRERLTWRRLEGEGERPAGPPGLRPRRLLWAPTAPAAAAAAAMGTNVSATRTASLAAVCWSCLPVRAAAAGSAGAAPTVLVANG